MKKFIAKLNLIRKNTNTLNRVPEISKMVDKFFASDTNGNSGIINYQGSKIYYWYNYNKNTYEIENA